MGIDPFRICVIKGHKHSCSLAMFNVRLQISVYNIHGCRAPRRIRANDNFLPADSGKWVFPNATKNLENKIKDENISLLVKCLKSILKIETVE